MKIVYQIRFFSDWHCGSGLCSGADVDELALKDSRRLPYIPGRTLKGLLREAACALGTWSGDPSWQTFRKTCFGEQSDATSPLSDQGCCCFSDAVLSARLQDSLAADAEKAAALFRKVSSTAINENGQAEDYSLRKTEVAVPLSLFAEIDGCEAGDVPKLEQCMQWIKRLGSDRHRGFGRCQFSAVQEGKP
jgi:CRISPR/Cas system CSM-associated protein Csm3 (group 7 of RAMP superfamily)